MIITVNLRGDAELVARFAKMPDAVSAAIYERMQFIVKLVEGRVKQKLSGKVLNVGRNRPGHTGGQLRSSIASTVERQAQAVLGRVFSSGDVPYAAIHEYGGRTGAHLIIPKAAAVLAFTKDGEKRFAKYVNHPGSTMPERSYMRSSLRELSTEISTQLKQAAVEGVRRR